MRSWSVNQHTNKYGLTISTALSCWQIVAVVLLGVIISMKLQPKIISPLSDNPFVETVIAKEVTPKTDVPATIRQIAGRHAPVLLRIASCESGLRENAWNTNKNGSIDLGVFQVNSIHFPRVPGINREAKIQWLLNGENNVSFGYILFLESGTRPWNASRRCWGA